MEEIKEFEDLLFRTAEYNCLKTRQEELRRSKRFPREDDVRKLRDYSVAEREKLANEYHFLNSSQYIRLRDLVLVVCRLTLFNARIEENQADKLWRNGLMQRKEHGWMRAGWGHLKKVASTSQLLGKNWLINLANALLRWYPTWF